MPKARAQLGWACPVCKLQFDTRASVREHLDQQHDAEERDHISAKGLGRVCRVCYQVFDTYDKLNRHMHANKHYGLLQHPCEYCYRRFETDSERKEHVNTYHFVHYTELEHAFDRKMVTIGRNFVGREVPSIEVLKRTQSVVLHRILDSHLHKYNSISVCLRAHVKFVDFDESGEETNARIIPFTTRSMNMFSGMRHKIQKDLAVMFADLDERVANLEEEGSGGTIVAVGALSVSIAKITFAGGAAADDILFISTLSQQEQDVLVDVQSHIRDGCLFSSVAQAFLPAVPGGHYSEGSERYDETKNFIEKYMKRKHLPVPTPMSYLASLERLNRGNLNFAINVYMKANRSQHDDNFGQRKRKRLPRGSKKTFFYPIYVSPNKTEAYKVVNLLLLRDQATDKMHFVYIANLDRLLRVGNTLSVCQNCLQAVRTTALKKHEDICARNHPQEIRMPQADEVGKPPEMKFIPAAKRFYDPIVGFIDFESANLNKKRTAAGGDKFGTDESYTEVLADQVPVMYVMAFFSSDGKLLYEKYGATDDSKLLMKKFFFDLAGAKRELEPLLNDMADEKPQLTALQDWEYRHADVCWICNEPFVKGDQAKRKVLDHSHSSLQNGKYMGAAHSQCNLLRTYQDRISIFCHNLQNYDSAFIISAFKDADVCDWHVKAMAQNTEKFRMLQIGIFRFLDSLHFLSSSLAKLVEDLATDNHPFEMLDQFEYKNLNAANNKQLLLAKGVFPYDFMTSLELMKNSGYPSHDKFYSVITESNISEQDYLHGRHVYEVAGCSSMASYTLLYCKLDVYLLAQVMFNFRQKVYDEFKLDATQFLSSPHLSFNIMLSLKREPIELMTDIDMHLMVEKGLRGGVAMTALRHVSLPEPVTERSVPSMIYTDAVNLYGYAMSQPLPAGEYSWLSDREINQIDWTEQRADQKYGYILEADLEYPPETHERHRSFPLAPEKIEIDYSMLSPYSKLVLEKNSGDGDKSHKRYKSQKLTATFAPRAEYVVHYRNLKLYLEQGMKLTKVHRVIKFRQSNFLARHVQLMTEKRKASKTVFEKSFYKLLINAIYGKLVQNLRKQMNCVFVRTEEQLARCIRNPSFDHWRIIGPKFVVFFNRKRSIFMNKPYVTGFGVLELAKEQMYNLFYNYIKLAAPNAEVLLTDTDSLLLHLPDLDKRTFLERCEPVFDLSNYPRDHALFNDGKKMIPGFLKDENAGNCLAEVVALKAKCYATKTATLEEEKKCKGVPHRTLMRDFNLASYLSVLNDVSVKRSTAHRLSLKSHTISLIRFRKVALNAFDDKRYIFPCGVHTHPYFSQYLMGGNTSCPACGCTEEEMNEVMLNE